jgi:hypothetical protein
MCGIFLAVVTNLGRNFDLCREEPMPSHSERVRRHYQPQTVPSDVADEATSGTPDEKRDADRKTDDRPLRDQRAPSPPRLVPRRSRF